MYTKIIATGGYLPEKIITNHDLSKTIDTSDEWIVTRTGISKRHIAKEGETTSDLAYYASKMALENIDVSTIDGIIVATITPNLITPSVATILQHRLGMPPIFAFDIQAACSGFIYALFLADSMIKAGSVKRLLIVGAETCSRFIDWKDRNTCVLFGDGAGAVVVEATKEDPKVNRNSGIIDIMINADGKYKEALYTKGGVSLGKFDYLTMQGQEVFKFAVTKMANVAEEILIKNNLKKEDIEFLIAHQANIRIINATANKLKIPPEKVVLTVQDHANTSAASIPLALHQSNIDGILKRGDLILSEAIGAGFTWACSLIRW